MLFAVTVAAPHRATPKVCTMWRQCVRKSFESVAAADRAAIGVKCHVKNIEIIGCEQHPVTRLCGVHNAACAHVCCARHTVSVFAVAGTVKNKDKMPCRRKTSGICAVANCWLLAAPRSHDAEGVRSKCSTASRGQ